MRDSVDNGISPLNVAQTIFEVTQKSRPNVRYPVGDRLQQLSPLIKRILPSRLFEKIMKDYYGLK